jgi:RimJ/RimL family protein N-acetyltransferase
MMYPIIETDRLVIRPVREADAEACLVWMGDPEVARYEYWDPYTLEKLREEFRELAAIPPASIGVWNLHGVVLREVGAVVGCVLIRMQDSVHRQAEIGFHFHKMYWGRGLATEAAEGLLAYGFETMGAHRIFGVADARNAASIRVLEKLGMRREAELRENTFVKGEWCDEVIYAMLDKEWRAKDRPQAR